MNDQERAVMQQALEALVSQFDGRADAIDILSAALAQQAEQKEKPWRCACGANLYIDENGAPRSKA